MKYMLVTKECGKLAEVWDLETDDLLATAQEFVGGDVECCMVGPDVVILCNEDGLASNLPNNCGFVGNIIFVQEIYDPLDGADWTSLSEENIRKALAWCQKHGNDVHPGNHTEVIFGDAAIDRHRERAKADAQSKLLEWQSL
jgi:Domain of unknown function (DUF3846)